MGSEEFVMVLVLGMKEPFLLHFSNGKQSFKISIYSLLFNNAFGFVIRVILASHNEFIS